MAFRLKPDEYFRGVVRDPGGDAELVIVSRGVRAATVKLTVKAAERRNLDWIIELRRDTDDSEGAVATLGHWSSMQGELPPATRGEVPGLN